MEVFYTFSLSLSLSVPPHSLSHSFGKNSSWIIFLEEQTNVRMKKLIQVLAKYDKNKVSVYIPPSLPLCLPLSLGLSLSISPDHSLRW